MRDERIARHGNASGKSDGTVATLAQSRAALAKELGHLSDLTKAIRNPVLYPVEFSPALLRLRNETERKLYKL